MNNRIGIIIGGLLAAGIAVADVELLSRVTEGIFAGRLLTMVIALVSTGVLYALTYAWVGGRNGNLEGMAAGIFAGALGGIFGWAIGGSLFGPFALTGLALTALIGGLLFSSQIDPKTDF